MIARGAPATAMALCDIGANMTDPVFRGIYRDKRKHDDDYDDVLERAFTAGVEKIIVTGGSLQDCREALKLVTENSRLYTTVGVHPTRCSEFEEFESGADKYYEELTKLCTEGRALGKVVAIGECGLDYDRLQFCPADAQRKYFEKQFDLAEATGLPMFLHCRNCDEDFVDLMRKHGHRISAGVVHSFTGSLDLLQQLLDLGLYIGLNGCSLKTEENLKVAAAVPEHRLLIETDAPWCDIRSTHAGFVHTHSALPVKNKPEKWVRGMGVKGRNEPVALVQVLQVLAAIRGVDEVQLAAATYHNSLSVFFPSALTEVGASTGGGGEAEE